MNDPYITVVIPCYDEMANLKKGVLENVYRFLQKKFTSFEVLIVDDESKDGSISFLKSFIQDNKKCRLIENSHMGKAGAVTTGMLQAKGTYILFTDMDQATPIDEMTKLLHNLENGFDIAIGSRSGKRKGAPWTRLVISKGMMILRKMIVGLPSITDTQCGFKMFRKDVAHQLFHKMYDLHHGFSHITGSAVTAGFDVELLMIAQIMKFRIKEVPVSWLYVETRRVNPVKDSIDGMLYLLQIRKNQIDGKYTLT